MHYGRNRENGCEDGFTVFGGVLEECCHGDGEEEEGEVMANWLLCKEVIHRFSRGFDTTNLIICPILLGR